MESEKIKQLVDKYLEGETSLEEEATLRAYFRSENISNKLKTQAQQFREMDKMRDDMPQESFDPFVKINFDKEKNNNQSVSQNKNVFSLSSWMMRIAAGLALLIIGYGAGRWASDRQYASSEKVSHLEKEVQQMKAALMNTGNYQTASAGERLSAIHISERIPANDQQLDQQIADILVYTMNNDKSVNVRLAAADALYRFRKDQRIKKALIESLAEQEDPLMQITLIDMLVELKAKDSINEMKKLLVDSDTKPVVRERLKVGIAQLKA